MPQLQEYLATFTVNGLDDIAPTVGLVVIVDAGRIQPSDALLGNHCGLRDYEASA